MHNSKYDKSQESESQKSRIKSFKRQWGLDFKILICSYLLALSKLSIKGYFCALPLGVYINLSSVVLFLSRVKRSIGFNFTIQMYECKK